MSSRSVLRTFVIGVSLVSLAACGGTKKDGTTANKKVGDDLDVEKGKGLNPEPVAKSTGPDGGVATTPTNDAGATASTEPDAGAVVDPNAPFVTFRLKNSTSKDIELNLNRGWGIVIVAYTGERGKNAKGIEMFPRFCSAACSSPKADRCPICKKPKGNKNEKDAQKREIIPPGKTLDVKWDGTVHKYKRTRGKRGRRCRCYETSKVSDETYTVEAFGLHITTSAKKRSKLQKASAKMTISGDNKQILVLDFQ